MEKIIIGVSLIIFLFFLIRTKINPALVFFALVCEFYLLGLIETKVFLGNFVNTSLVTLIVLLLVSIALEKVHFIANLPSKILQGGSYRLILLKMSALVVSASAFINNTAIVAMLIGPLKSQKQIPASKLLIPLSYFSILGGTITLIGTSTNLIVNSFVEEAGLEPLKMFDFFIVGMIVAIGGTISIMYYAPKILPVITNAADKEEESYFLEAKVQKKSKLIGKSIKENNLRNLDNLFLVEILRKNTLISLVSPNFIIEEDDILFFTGDVSDIETLKYFDGLELYEDAKNVAYTNTIEVILSHNSTLINKSVKQADFRAKFDAAIIGIKRGDKKLSGQIGKQILQAGDNLILAIGDDFKSRTNIKKNFYVVNSFQTTDQLSPMQSKLALVGFGLVVLLSSFGILSLLNGLLILLGAFLIFNFINYEQLKRLFPFDLVLIIGSALGISHVLYSSGLANDLADAILKVSSLFGTYGSFVGIFLLTTLLTEIMTNNAAAALSFPIALATAQSVDANAMPFIMAVAYGASASFMSPYGYQTNLMVCGAGGYSLKHFVSIGFRVFLAHTLIAMSVIPIVFPL